MAKTNFLKTWNIFETWSMKHGKFQKLPHIYRNSVKKGYIPNQVALWELKLKELVGVVSFKHFPPACLTDFRSGGWADAFNSLTAIFISLMLFHATYETRDSQCWTLACVEGQSLLSPRQLSGCGGDVPAGPSWAPGLPSRMKMGALWGKRDLEKWMWCWPRSRMLPTRVSHLLPSTGRCWRRLPYISGWMCCYLTWLLSSSSARCCYTAPTAPPWSAAYANVVLTKTLLTSGFCESGFYSPVFFSGGDRSDVWRACSFRSLNKTAIVCLQMPLQIWIFSCLQCESSFFTLVPPGSNGINTDTHSGFHAVWPNSLIYWSNLLSRTSKKRSNCSLLKHWI